MDLFFTVVLFILILIGLVSLNRHNAKWSLAQKVFIGLVAGIVFGVSLQLFYGNTHPIVLNSLEWIDVIGTGYVNLLQMIVMPLILMSIFNAVAKLHDATSLGKLSLLTISLLLFTTFIAAIIGILVTLAFGLTAEGLTAGSQEAARLATLESHHIKALEDLTVPQILLSFIPQNPFLDLTGARVTSIISVVIFAVFLGVAALKLFQINPTKGKKVLDAIDMIQLLVMQLVKVVMVLTPYGIFALMVRMSAHSDLQDIIQLGGFLVGSYVAILLMFCIHVLVLALTGISPWRFIKKIMPMLIFAFSSRSSAATIPFNIETQTQRFGVPSSIASFSASFGATIGQNGCAGIYPAMLATMVAPTVGLTADFHWFTLLVFVITISSIGVAGVGGGATFSALIVLPIMGLPIELIALLISIEPLIDMARTALNVSGALTAGVVTSQLMGETNKKVLKDSK